MIPRDELEAMGWGALYRVARSLKVRPSPCARHARDGACAAWCHACRRALVEAILRATPEVSRKRAVDWR